MTARGIQINLSTKCETGKHNLNANCLNYREGTEAEPTSTRLITCNFRNCYKVWFEGLILQPGSLSPCICLHCKLNRESAYKGDFF